MSISILKGTVDIDLNSFKKWQRLASLAFGFLSQNLGWAHFHVLDFQTYTEMSIKGIKMRCSELMILLITSRYLLKVLSIWIKVV